MNASYHPDAPSTLKPIVIQAQHRHSSAAISRQRDNQQAIAMPPEVCLPYVLAWVKKGGDILSNRVYSGYASAFELVAPITRQTKIGRLGGTAEDDRSDVIDDHGHAGKGRAAAIAAPVTRIGCDLTPNSRSDPRSCGYWRQLIPGWDGDWIEYPRHFRRASAYERLSTNWSVFVRSSASSASSSGDSDAWAAFRSNVS